MHTWVWIVIAVVIILILAAIALTVTRRRRSQALRQRFGPEYDRTVARTGNRGQAEQTLESRVERRKQLDIRALSPDQRQGYEKQWNQVQADFVDAPRRAVREADLLVTQVMRDRGYPMDDFESRAGDISVDHPQVVENYRAAHRISQSNAQNQGTTEELRQAMVHFRFLFQELLAVTTPQEPGQPLGTRGARAQSSP